MFNGDVFPIFVEILFRITDDTVVLFRYSTICNFWRVPQSDLATEHHAMSLEGTASDLATFVCHQKKDKLNM